MQGEKAGFAILEPAAGRFLATMGYGVKAAEAALAADLPEAVKATIREATVYPEGRGVPVQVATAEDLDTLMKMVAIKQPTERKKEAL